MVKLGIGLALAAVAAGFLIVAAQGARHRGKMTHCRNNLRKLGELSFQRMGSEDPIVETGRKFWQEVRVEHFTTMRQGKEEWFTRFGGLNPFACPVRGAHPLNLSGLTQEELARHMSAPSTIDYRGPRTPPVATSVGLQTVGGDLEGNHPKGGGHVLLADLSIREVRTALLVKPFADDPAANAGLSE